MPDENNSARSLTSGLCLAIDTTGERCSACLFDGDRMSVLALAEPLIGKGHAERLMEVIAGVLADGGATYSDLARIVVAVGPGSFTGIRVGVSVARGLSLALGVPAVGVGVLEALAEPHLGGDGSVLAVQDARRGEIYVSLHASDGVILCDPAAILPGALPAFVETAGEMLLMTGSGAAIAAGHLTGRQSRIVDESGLPAIADIARIGARRVPEAAVRPLYLRLADAKPPAPSALLQRGSSSIPAPTLR